DYDRARQCSVRTFRACAAAPQARYAASRTRVADRDLVPPAAAAGCVVRSGAQSAPADSAAHCAVRSAARRAVAPHAEAHFAARQSAVRCAVARRAEAPPLAVQDSLAPGPTEGAPWADPKTCCPRAARGDPDCPGAAGDPGDPAAHAA